MRKGKKPGLDVWWQHL